MPADRAAAWEPARDVAAAVVPGARPIARAHALAPSAFRRDHELPRKPVVITGALDGRAALERWSFDYLAAESDVPVQVRISRRGAPQLFNGNPGVAFDFRSMPLRVALEHFAKPADDVWYVQHCDLAALPRLQSEIGALDYVPRRFRSRSMLWVSGPGTVNPLHWDTHHAMLAQITGTKRFVVFPPEDSPKLASFEHRALWRTSALDLAAIDRARFPRFDTTSAWSGIVRPGDVLFIPYAWWHYMECDDPSISVTWWWPPSLTVHLRDSLRERASTWIKRGLRLIRTEGAR